jgi:predicted TIM-barrel fold metal-dependent hydrolase
MTAWQLGRASLPLAKMPNVACKVSGVLAYCQPDHATAAAVRPYVEHSLEQFGWDRVVWGSDWPVVLMTATLADWVRISQDSSPPPVKQNGASCPTKTPCGSTASVRFCR